MFFRRGFVYDFAGRCGHRPIRDYRKPIAAGLAPNITAIPSLPQMREMDFAKQKTEGETLFAKKQIVFLSPSRDNATTAPSSEGAIMCSHMFCGKFAGR